MLVAGLQPNGKAVPRMVVRGKFSIRTHQMLTGGVARLGFGAFGGDVYGTRRKQ